MPRLTLPDGTHPELPEGEPIGIVLGPDAIAARVDGELRDLSFVPAADVSVEPVDAGSDDGLQIIRHSAAHVLAQAVCRLWPGTKYAIGPAIKDGFYYDFAIPAHVSADELPRIEEEMRAIVAEDQPFIREEVSRSEALARVADQDFKREIIEDLAGEEGEVGPGDTVILYRNDHWVDLCLGPHVPSTERIGAFTLTSISGAYWRGDEKNPQLTRIYGTAWASKEDLEAHLHRLEEAERRDHRLLGRQLDLFSSPEELGPGLWVWHPRGGVFRKQLEDWVRDLHLARGYDLVVTPHIARSVLWETSGHLAKYSDNMYPPMQTDTGDYYVKPMNCPFHVLVYDQLVDEILAVFDLTLEIHRTFGFSDPIVTLSTLPGQTILEPEMAARATETLVTALDRYGLPYTEAEGEGTFYGPKVDFHFRDAIGRLWQLTTVQCDFALPERFDMEYTGEDNQRHRPVMIHRAILGTLERFSAVLIEHYAGAFPLWLSPEQIRFVPVADRHVEHCRTLADQARAAGLRPFVDDAKESVGKKIRAAQLMKVPYTIVVGDRDLEAGTFTIRDRHGTETPGVPFDAIVDALSDEAGSRRLRSTDFATL